jgi:DNA-binding NtrC family response regulator
MSRILIVQSDNATRTAFGRHLQGQGHSVRTVSGRMEHEILDDGESPDIVLVFDTENPESSIAMARPWMEEDPYLQVVFLAEAAQVEQLRRQELPEGFGFLALPCSAERLAAIVGQATETRRQLQQQAIAQRLRRAPTYDRRILPGTSPALMRVNLLVSRVAKSSNTPVLLTGETGTGKELAAEAIHYNSPRARGPIVKVNCAAIPAPLVEGELFGHERGSFTSATESRKGLFELAEGGTIVLDEIGELDLSVQPKLLRVLQDHVVRRVGGVKDRRVDVRVIASTNRDLVQLVNRRMFREDLYFRLAVMRITLPPLRERKGDIPLLATMFLQQKSIEVGRHVTGFCQEVLDRFEAYHWPGNVRELQNVVERLIILTDGPLIEMTESVTEAMQFSPSRSGLGGSGLRLPAPGGASSVREEPEPKALAAPRPAACAASVEGQFRGLSAEAVRTLDEVEREYLKAALCALGFNKSRTAQRLGISRSTLRRKLAQYGLDEWVAQHSLADEEEGD